MDINDVKEFFFKASFATYAGNEEKTTILDLPKSKVLVYPKNSEHWGFDYADLYYVSASGPQSFGQTTIWYDGVPVWGMQYGGYYPKDVIPFLKAALRNAYLSKLFCGGRGLPEYSDGSLLYTNHPEPNDFTNFAGEERIYRAIGLNPEPIGRHWYRGYSLM